MFCVKIARNWYFSGTFWKKYPRTWVWVLTCRRRIPDQSKSESPPPPLVKNMQCSVIQNVDKDMKFLIKCYKIFSKHVNPRLLKGGGWLPLACHWGLFSGPLKSWNLPSYFINIMQFFLCLSIDARREIHAQCVRVDSPGNDHFFFFFFFQNSFFWNKYIHTLHSKQKYLPA